MVMAQPQTAESFDAQRRMVGRRLGRYHVGPRIGVGGSAAVYLARLTGPMSFERMVALKVVHEHLSEENEFISQFLDEANLLVRLAHPNIVQVYELGREGETLFLAMEYLHGQPLSKLTSVLSRRGQRLPAHIVAWIGARVAEGLAYAHRLADDDGHPLGLVHRDVSPQNAFVNYDGAVKLIDFGIARAKGRIAQTTLGRIKGKFSYMAPEQVLGRDFDHRADIFALGATLYEAAVGARLFAGVDESETLHKLLFEEVPDPAARVKDFPAELGRILRRSLAGNADERYPDADELARDLDAFVKSVGEHDIRQELVGILARLFESERAEQDRAIETLRAEAIEVALPSARPSLDSIDALSGSRPVTPPKKRVPTWAYAAGGFAAVAVVGVLVAALRGSSAAPQPSTSASAAPIASMVSVEVVVQPDVPATITLDGTRLEGKPARITRPKAARAAQIEVQANGYQPSKLSIVLDRDRSVVIPLAEVAPPPPPSASAPPKKDPKAKSGPLPTSRPPKGKGKGDPLVTDYPF